MSSPNVLFSREKRSARTFFRPIGATKDLENSWKNAAVIAKVGVDTAENGPSRVRGLAIFPLELAMNECSMKDHEGPLKDIFDAL